MLSPLHKLSLDSSEIQLMECPRCAARIRLRRTDDPHIDSAGFESYTLTCTECTTSFSGIIDPYDDVFLIEGVNPEGL